MKKSELLRMIEDNEPAAIEAATKALQEVLNNYKPKPVKRKGRVLCESEINVCDKYYFLSIKGDKYQTTFDHDTSDEKMINQGRAFHDEESAQRFSDYERLRQRMRKAARDSGEIDWSDESQRKHYVYYDFQFKCLDISFVCTCKRIGQIYFATRESLQAFIDSLTDYEKELLREGE